MWTALTRVAALILGVATLAFALLGTLGVAILVPLGMLVAGLWARRRGRSLTALQGWVAGVVPFGSIVTLGLVAAVLFGPLRGKFDDFRRTIVDAQKQTPEQPAFMRQLHMPPPAPLPPSVAAPLATYTTIVGLEFWCVLMGTITWGGSSLLVFGVRGPRPPLLPPDPSPESVA
jgi:hypothetical protein